MDGGALVPHSHSHNICYETFLVGGKLEGVAPDQGSACQGILSMGELCSLCVSINPNLHVQFKSSH